MEQSLKFKKYNIMCTEDSARHHSEMEISRPLRPQQKCSASELGALCLFLGFLVSRAVTSKCLLVKSPRLCYVSY